MMKSERHGASHRFRTGDEPTASALSLTVGEYHRLIPCVLGNDLE